MNKCIYLKEKISDLTFSSREHIIPAGIGGIRTLDLGIVSDQANSIFSGLELDFMRNSLISIPRQFLGPGKRGSLSVKKATKSNIHIMSNTEDLEDVSLGYLKLSKPHKIPQMIIKDQNEVRMIFDLYDGKIEEQFNKFMDDLKKYNGKNITIFDDSIPKEYVLLGRFQDKWYLACSNEDNLFNIDNIIKQVINHDFKSEPQYGKAHIYSHQRLAFNVDNYFRVCAKIIFNFLASSKGANFVMQENFDPIRNWIINGGENFFATLVDRNDGVPILEGIPLPETAHRIFIIKIDNQLIGLVCFYGNHFQTSVLLCDNFQDTFDLEGFICDWESRKESKFIDYLNSLYNRE